MNDIQVAQDARTRLVQPPFLDYPPCTLLFVKEPTHARKFSACLLSDWIGRSACHVRKRSSARNSGPGTGRRYKGNQRDAQGAAGRVEPRRLGRLSGRILALAGTHIFRRQRRISWLGKRAGTVQEELPGSRRDGPIEFFGFGVSLPGAGRGARSWPMALE